jgi:hypothetical protein
METASRFGKGDKDPDDTLKGTNDRKFEDVSTGLRTNGVWLSVVLVLWLTHKNTNSHWVQAPFWIDIQGISIHPVVLLHEHAKRSRFPSRFSLPMTECTLSGR